MRDHQPHTLPQISGVQVLNLVNIIFNTWQVEQQLMVASKYNKPVKCSVLNLSFKTRMIMHSLAYGNSSFLLTHWQHLWYRACCQGRPGRQPHTHCSQHHQQEGSWGVKQVHTWPFTVHEHKTVAWLSLYICFPHTPDESHYSWRLSIKDMFGKLIPVDHFSLQHCRHKGWSEGQGMRLAT